MQILYDTQVILPASLERVWEALTDPEQRPQWQDGVRAARLDVGSPGYRGAQTRLRLDELDDEVVETVQRSRPLERLQTQLTVGDCSYRQMIYLLRLDDDTTQLTYHCKQALKIGWRKILHIRPAVPACVQPEIYDSLARQLEQSVTH